MAQGTQPADIVGATVRLSVHAGSRRLDLVVPAWFEADDLAGTVAERWGLADPPTLHDATGRPLAAGAPLAEVGVRHGAVVVVPETRGTADGPGSQQPGAHPDAGPDAGPGATAGAIRRRTDRVPVWVPTWVVDLAPVAVVVGAVSAAYGGDALLRHVVVGLLLVLAAAALLPARRDLPAGLLSQRRHLVPWCLGGAALTAVGASPGQPLLPVAVAGLGAFAAAGILRAATDDHVVSLVWLWGAGGFAVVSTTLLVVGAGEAGLWSALLVVALVVVRLLPTLVVDVPDDVLLAIDQLAVTAWSARDDQPRGRRRRRVVRRGEVRQLARRGGALLRAGTAGGVAVVVVAGVLLLLVVGGQPTWVVVGAEVQVGLVAVVLALLGRGYRDWRLQVLLRAAGAVLLAAVALAVASRLDEGGLVALVAVLAVVAAGAVGAAVALGRGWRSVWWARVADVGQGLLFATALALTPLASGLFDHVWRFTS